MLNTHFIIHTDHQSIKYFLEQRLNTILQQRWLSKLLGYDYELRYKKWKDNRVADALSRVPAEQAQLSALASVQPAWLQEVLDSYQGDEDIQQLISELVISNSHKPHYTYTGGLVRFKG